MDNCTNSCTYKKPSVNVFITYSPKDSLGTQRFNMVHILRFLPLMKSMSYLVHYVSPRQKPIQTLYSCLLRQLNENPTLTKNDKSSQLHESRENHQ